MCHCVDCSDKKCPKQKIEKEKREILEEKKRLEQENHELQEELEETEIALNIAKSEDGFETVAQANKRLHRKDRS